jgi:hypothetical protein
VEPKQATAYRLLPTAYSLGSQCLNRIQS